MIVTRRIGYCAIAGVLAGAVGTISCLATSGEPIIARYRAAVCVPCLSHSRIDPKTREWDHTLTLSDGSRVIVRGAEMVGGSIGVRYLDTGQSEVAANAGDYVYPADVRIDTEKDLLYVVASGLAGGIFDVTVLFEYDLRNHRLLSQRHVSNRALPTASTDKSENE